MAIIRWFAHIFTKWTSFWPNAVPHPGHFRWRISKFLCMHWLQNRWKHFTITTCQREKAQPVLLVLLAYRQNWSGNMPRHYWSKSAIWLITKLKWSNMPTDLLWPVETHTALKHCPAILYFVLEPLHRSLSTLSSQFSNLFIPLHNLFLQLLPLLSASITFGSEVGIIMHSYLIDAVTIHNI